MTVIKQLVDRYGVYFGIYGSCKIVENQCTTAEMVMLTDSNCISYMWATQRSNIFTRTTYKLFIEGVEKPLGLSYWEGDGKLGLSYWEGDGKTVEQAPCFPGGCILDIPLNL